MRCTLKQEHLITLITKRFPAHDELGMCRTSLVSPEHPEHLEERVELNKKGQDLKDAQKLVGQQAKARQLQVL